MTLKLCVFLKFLPYKKGKNILSTQVFIYTTSFNLHIEAGSNWLNCPTSYINHTKCRGQDLNYRLYLQCYICICVLLFLMEVRTKYVASEWKFLLTAEENSAFSGSVLSLTGTKTTNNSFQPWKLFPLEGLFLSHIPQTHLK